MIGVIALSFPGSGLAADRGYCFDCLATSVAIDDYLIHMDFVVDGIVEDVSSSSSAIPIEIGSVALGSLPGRRIYYHRITRTKTGEHVLAWGTWCEAVGDTCFGNMLVIGREGELLPARLGGAAMLPDSASVSAPGSYERVRERLSGRRLEHGLEWLAEARSVELVKIESIEGYWRILHIAPIRTLVGPAPAKMPSILALARQYTFVPHVGDSLIVGIPSRSRDTLAVSTCMDRLQLLPGNQGTVLGVPLDQVGNVLIDTGSDLELQPFHGVQDDHR